MIKNKGKFLNTLYKNKYFWIILLAHTILVFYFFGTDNIFNNQPIYNVDYPMHFYECQISENYYHGWQAWIYNPFFKAGFPSQSSLNNALMQAFCAFTPILSKLAIFKIWIVLIFFLLPIFIYYATLNFNFKKTTAQLAMLIFLIYLYFDSLCSFLLKSGMFNYVYANIFSLFYLSLFYRYIIFKERKIFFWLLFTFPIFPLIHSSVILIFFLPFLVLLLVYKNYLNTKLFYKIVLILILPLANLYLWVLRPVFMNVKIVEYPYFFTIGPKQILKWISINAPHEGILHYLVALFSLLKFSWIIIPGIIGIYFLYKKNKLSYFFILICPVFLIISVFFNFRFMPDFMKHIEPNRYLVTLNLFLIIPAAVALKRIYTKKSKNFIKIIYICMAVLIFFSFFLGYLYPPILPHGFPKNITTNPPNEYIKLKQWIINYTSTDSRIMVESGYTTKSFFDNGSMLMGLMSLETGRQFLGGPHIHPSSEYDFPSFTSNNIFRHDWNISDEKLISYLELYNIGTIITKSSFAKKQLDIRYEKGILLSKLKIDNFNIYITNFNKNFIIGGSGEIMPSINKIQINNLKTNNNEIILKFHWHPGLKAEGDIIISPVYFNGLPVPFIKISNIKNQSLIIIYNSYE